MRYRAAAIALVFGALVGCSGTQKLAGTLAELQEVRRQVVLATGHENIHVNLNNDRHLTVSLINSPLKQLPTEEKRLRAKEIATIAYRALPSRASLERVAVVFAVHRRYFLVFNYSDATDHHPYSAKDLVK